MYSFFSIHNIILYRLKKIFFTILGINKGWKIPTLLSLVFLIGCMVFSFAFAQGTTTPSNSSTSSSTSDNTTNLNQNTPGLYCETGSSVSPYTTATRAIWGTLPCDKYPTSIDRTGYTVNQQKPSTTTSSSTSPVGSVYDQDYLNRYYKQGGALQAMMFGAGALYDMRPASTYDSVVYMARDTGLFASAQVQGFNQFAPITVLWGIFRNISLLLFVVVFVIIGFFILIQRKIGGQETVSLVSSITNAAVAMIVITFSYAIGGVIVDIFSNVMNGVVATTFNSLINSQELLQKLNTPNSGVNVLTLMSELSNIGVSSSATNLFQTSLIGLNYPASQIKNVFGGLNVGPGIGSFNIGSAIGFFASVFVDILMGIINSGFNNSALINAIVAFVIFIVTLRVVFALLGAYVSLVFKIMFAPFILLPAALPGNATKVVMGWILSLIASALTFPAIFACILMSAIFLNLNANIAESGSDNNPCTYESQLNPGNSSVIQGNQKPSKFIVVTRNGVNPINKAECFPLALPPQFNYWPAPLGYINGVEPDDLIRFVLALAFIVLTPSVPKMLQSILKVPQDNLLGGIGQSLKGGTGAFSSLISKVPSFGLGRAIGDVTKTAVDSAG